MEETGRTRQDVSVFVSDLIKERLGEIDLTDPNSALVFNGGTGVGKTTAIMEELLPILEAHNQREVSVLVVESRSATRDQLVEQYKDTIREEGKISVIQRFSFAKMIEEERLPEFDYIVIDECHSLFSDASFANDAVIVSYWIKEKKTDEKLIFITACDEYFDKLIKRFTGRLTLHYFFPDFTYYCSGTYIKRLSYIKTSQLEKTIDFIMKEKKGKKGLVFLQSARDAMLYANKYSRQGYNTSSIISKMNETPSSLMMKDEDYDDFGVGRSIITLSEVQTLMDEKRAIDGKVPIREALLHKTYPDDIDVIFATNTISEGISIESHIDFIFIEGFGEEEVEQKSGRYRGNLDELFLVFYPQKFARRQEFIEDTFQFLLDHPLELGEYYGRQEAGQFKVKFILKKVVDEETVYIINTPALLAERERAATYKLMMKGGLSMVEKLYGHKVKGEIRQLTTNDFDRTERDAIVTDICDRWQGIPIIGFLKEKFLKEWEEKGIKTDNGKKMLLRNCCDELRKVGREMKQTKISKKDIKRYPELEDDYRKNCYIIN